MIEYKGYRIQHERFYYRVISLADPSDTWTVDTIEEAKEDIDFIWDNFN